MEKYKVCPVCGEHNPPTMLECLKCEADLSSIRVVDEMTEKAIEEKESTISTENGTVANGRMVRICEECGTKNPMPMRKCSQCGEDISYIVAVSDSLDEEIHYVLASLDDDFVFELIDKNTIVGRENAMQDYLSVKSYVSRKHAEFLLENGKVFLKNYSHTNYSFINNEKVLSEDFVELHDGDVIGLGGNELNGERQNQAAYFRMRIGSCM